MSSKEEILAPLISALKDLTDWFKNTHIPVEMIPHEDSPKKIIKGCYL